LSPDLTEGYQRITELKAELNATEIVTVADREADISVTLPATKQYPELRVTALLAGEEQPLANEAPIE
jgi:hypothetical protein